MCANLGKEQFASCSSGMEQPTGIVLVTGKLNGHGADPTVPPQEIMRSCYRRLSSLWNQTRVPGSSWMSRPPRQFKKVDGVLKVLHCLFVRMATLC